MNSTTRETTSCKAAPRLISRTMKRLIFCSRRSWCSVCSSRDSSSFTRDTVPLLCQILQKKKIIFKFLS